MARCTVCGATVDGSAGAHDDYQYCSDCERNYQRWYAEEYPHGQCQECGVNGIQRPDGTVHFAHVEGGCSTWNDD